MCRWSDGPTKRAHSHLTSSNCQLLHIFQNLSRRGQRLRERNKVEGGYHVGGGFGERRVLLEILCGAQREIWTRILGVRIPTRWQASLCQQLQLQERHHDSQGSLPHPCCPSGMPSNHLRQRGQDLNISAPSFMSLGFPLHPHFQGFLLFSSTLCFSPSLLVFWRCFNTVLLLLFSSTFDIINFTLQFYTVPTRDRAQAGIKATFTISSNPHNGSRDRGSFLHYFQKLGQITSILPNQVIRNKTLTSSISSC